MLTSPLLVSIAILSWLTPGKQACRRGTAVGCARLHLASQRRDAGTPRTDDPEQTEPGRDRATRGSVDDRAALQRHASAAGERLFDFFQNLTGAGQADLRDGCAELSLGVVVRGTAAPFGEGLLRHASATAAQRGVGSAPDVVHEAGRQLEAALLRHGDDFRRW